MKNNFIWLACCLDKAFCLALFCTCAMLAFSCGQQDTAVPAAFSPNIPVDVDPATQEALKKAGDIYQLNEKFNEFSWQAFVAIFWPRDKAGNPMPKFTDPGKATWLGWKEAFQVYRKDGGVPTPWGSPRTGVGLGLTDTSFLGDTEARVFLSNVTPTGILKSKNIADEEDQAFAGKLFDQNGNVVVYEVLMNQAEFDYVVANKLYNINGQIDFSKNGAIANFPKGDYTKGQVGAVEIKFAWKILEATDHKARYYSTTGYVLDEKTQKWVKKDLGMIGFHISQKTPTGSQWVWSTFEHIDNLDQNVIVGQDGKKTLVHPTLTDPDCEICPINVDVSNGTTYQYNTGAHGNYWTVSGDTSDRYYANSQVMKTQAKRMIDIPVRVQQINQMMQTYFKSQNSVWQYYQLIDTQYPLDQKVPPAPHEQATYKVPESVVNKPGGNPNIALLTNITMETFFQLGNQSAGNLIEGSVTSPITIFGTESCMGCHSSAGIYTGINPQTGHFTQAGQLSGDFSWLLSQKAQWDIRVPRPLIPPHK